MRTQFRERIPDCVLFFACIAFFGACLGFGFVSFDDDEFVVENSLVNQGVTLEGLKWALTTKDSGEIEQGVDNLWTPLAWIVLMIEAEIYGLNPKGFHLTGLVLHLISTLLVFQITKILCRKYKGGSSEVWMAFLVALLFCVHPLRVESVVWISERKGQLCAMFLLSAWWCHLKNNTPTWFVVSLMAFLLACLSKPVAVMFPLILVLDDFLSAKNENQPIRFSLATIVSYLKSKIWWLVPAAGVALITIYLQSSGTKADEGGGGLALVIPRLLQYIVAFFAPVNLNIYYPVPGWATGWWLSPAVLVGGSSLAWLMRSKWQNEPLLVLGLGWFVIWLIPVLGFVHVSNSFVNDRYTYLPHLGLALALVSVLGRVKYGRAALLLVTFFFFAPLTFLRLPAWENSRALYSAGIKNQPTSSLCYVNLALIEKQEGRIEEAYQLYRKAVEINPLDHLAYFNMGNIHHEEEEYEKAISAYQEVVRLFPVHHASHGQLALCYIKQGDLDMARSHIERACQLSPNPAYRVVRRHLENQSSSSSPRRLRRN